MIQFIASEIKMAVIWVKDVVVKLTVVCFRWTLRWAMLGLIFLVMGKGCSRAVLAIAPVFLKTSQVQSTQGILNPSAVPPPNPYEIGSNQYEKVTSARRTTASTEVRSVWSTLRYVGQDLMRWFRK